MRSVFAARQSESDALFDRIRAFMAEHRLTPEPEHYQFAYAVLTEPGGPVALAVKRLTDGGVRLTGSDIADLGGQPVARPSSAVADDCSDDAARLVAETQAQVDGFAHMVETIRDETHGFGRDLAAMSREPEIAGIEEIARLTGAMLGRIRDAEVRLATATDEANALREKLAEANDTARRDVLTGLPNRRAFDEALAQRRMAEGPFCLALCDVDRFKHINDDHGHVVGDRVLAALSRSLQEACGDHFVARYGGEEFAVLMAGCDLAAATEQLDAVRATIAARRFRVRETDRPLGKVTLSIGITAIRGDEATADAYDRADRLLYTAKASGRDRVCAA